MTMKWYMIRILKKYVALKIWGTIDKENSFILQKSNNKKAWIHKTIKLSKLIKQKLKNMKIKFQNWINKFLIFKNNLYR